MGRSLVLERFVPRTNLGMVDRKSLRTAPRFLAADRYYKIPCTGYNFQVKTSFLE